MLPWFSYGNVIDRFASGYSDLYSLRITWQRLVLGFSNMPTLPFPLLTWLTLGTTLYTPRHTRPFSELAWFVCCDMASMGLIRWNLVWRLSRLEYAFFEHRFKRTKDAGLSVQFSDRENGLSYISVLCCADNSVYAQHWNCHTLFILFITMSRSGPSLSKSDQSLAPTSPFFPPPHTNLAHNVSSLQANQSSYYKGENIPAYISLSTPRTHGRVIYSLRRQRPGFLHWSGQYRKLTSNGRRDFLLYVITKSMEAHEQFRAGQFPTEREDTGLDSLGKISRKLLEPGISPNFSLIQVWMLHTKDSGLERILNMDPNSYYSFNGNQIV